MLSIRRLRSLRLEQRRRVAWKSPPPSGAATRVSDLHKEWAPNQRRVLTGAVKQNLESSLPCDVLLAEHSYHSRKKCPASEAYMTKCLRSLQARNRGKVGSDQKHGYGRHCERREARPERGNPLRLRCHCERSNGGAECGNPLRQAVRLNEGDHCRRAHTAPAGFLSVEAGDSSPARVLPPKIGEKHRLPSGRGCHQTSGVRRGRSRPIPPVRRYSRTKARLAPRGVRDIAPPAPRAVGPVG